MPCVIAARSLPAVRRRRGWSEQSRRAIKRGRVWGHQLRPRAGCGGGGSACSAARRPTSSSPGAPPISRLTGGGGRRRGVGRPRKQAAALPHCRPGGKHMSHALTGAAFSRHEGHEPPWAWACGGAFAPRPRQSMGTTSPIGGTQDQCQRRGFVAVDDFLVLGLPPDGQSLRRRCTRQLKPHIPRNQSPPSRPTASPAATLPLFPARLDRSPCLVQPTTAAPLRRPPFVAKLDNLRFPASSRYETSA